MISTGRLLGLSDGAAVGQRRQDGRMHPSASNIGPTRTSQNVRDEPEMGPITDMIGAYPGSHPRPSLGSEFTSRRSDHAVEPRSQHIRHDVANGGDTAPAGYWQSVLSGAWEKPRKPLGWDRGKIAVVLIALGMPVHLAIVLGRGVAFSAELIRGSRTSVLSA